MQRQQTVRPESPKQVMQISLVLPLSQHAGGLTICHEIKIAKLDYLLVLEH
jgi:hypothetical protein